MRIVLKRFRAEFAIPPRVFFCEQLVLRDIFVFGDFWLNYDTRDFLADSLLLGDSFFLFLRHLVDVIRQGPWSSEQKRPSSVHACFAAIFLCGSAVSTFFLRLASYIFRIKAKPPLCGCYALAICIMRNSFEYRSVESPEDRLKVEESGTTLQLQYYIGACERNRKRGVSGVWVECLVFRRHNSSLARFFSHRVGSRPLICSDNAG